METERDDIQIHSDGAGPMYHRVYSVELPFTYDVALGTMKEVMADPNAFSPQLIARFEKTKGDDGRLCEDDEFMVHLSAPWWKGPVRVAHVSEGSFTLLTREGHIEAGHIQFRLVRLEGARARFEIESVTRSKDRLVDLFYDKLRLAQLAQTEMWELFCKAVAKKSFSENGVKAEIPPVAVHTERQDPETHQWVDVSEQFGAQI